MSTLHAFAQRLLVEHPIEAGLPPRVEVVDEIQSQVAFDIQRSETPALGVKLTITHDGFDSVDSEMLKGVSDGWVMILSTLKTLLEREGSAR